MAKRIEIVVSSLPIISNAIEANLSSESAVDIDSINLNNSIDLLNYNKIDLLILDKNSAVLHQKHVINEIITIDCVLPNIEHVTIRSPFNLSYLLDRISSSRKSEQIFCLINNRWVYNQRLATICDNANHIRFTEKENTIFSSMLKAENYQMHKTEMLRTIWNYNTQSHSTIIESSLFRLKQKIPDDLLQHEKNHYQLKILAIK